MYMRVFAGIHEHVYAPLYEGACVTPCLREGVSENIFTCEGVSLNF